MRIAMMTNNYKPVIGGVPISIERLAAGLRQIGDEVTVFAPTYPDQTEEEGVVRYRSLKRFSGIVGGGCVVPNCFDTQLERAVARGDYDVIHVHHPILVGYTALYLGRKYRIPVTFTYHTQYEQYLHFLRPYAALERRSQQEKLPVLREAEKKALHFASERAVPAHMRTFANHCDMVFAPTGTLRDHLLSMGVKSSIEVLPTGLQDSSFRENAERSAAIRRRYRQDRKFLFCTVSRLSAEKNLSFLLRGLREFRDRAGDCFRMLFIGEGPQREALEREVLSLGIGENVAFAGSVDNREIADYCRACDLFLFASKSETQGIVLLESMAAATPVIAVRACGTSDVVRDGVNGFLTSEDEGEWASRIQDALRDPLQWEHLREGAFQEAGRYRSGAVAQRAHSSYERVCREQVPHTAASVAW